LTRSLEQICWGQQTVPKRRELPGMVNFVFYRNVGICDCTRHYFQKAHTKTQRTALLSHYSHEILGAPAPAGELGLWIVTLDLPHTRKIVYCISLSGVYSHIFLSFPGSVFRNLFFRNILSSPPSGCRPEGLRHNFPMPEVPNKTVRLLGFDIQM
jgi:hypothetical protein